MTSIEQPTVSMASLEVISDLSWGLRGTVGDHPALLGAKTTSAFSGVLGWFSWARANNQRLHAKDQRDREIAVLKQTQATFNIGGGISAAVSRVVECKAALTGGKSVTSHKVASLAGKIGLACGTGFFSLWSISNAYNFYEQRQVSVWLNDNLGDFTEEQQAQCMRCIGMVPSSDTIEQAKTQLTQNQIKTGLALTASLLGTFMMTSLLIFSVVAGGPLALAVLSANLIVATICLGLDAADLKDAWNTEGPVGNWERIFAYASLVLGALCAIPAVLFLSATAAPVIWVASLIGLAWIGIAMTNIYILESRDIRAKEGAA